MANGEAKPPGIISRSTVIPVGLVITIVGAAGMAVFILSQKIHQIDTAGTDRWTQTDMRHYNDLLRERVAHWAELLQAKNPELEIPPIELPELWGSHNEHDN